jgi:hypothetical protein
MDDNEDFMHRKASMKEIRVGWRLGLHEDDDGNPLDGGLWTADSPAVRRDLLIVVEAGNEVAGEGSHWLEEREA